MFVTCGGALVLNRINQTWCVSELAAISSCVGITWRLDCVLPSSFTATRRGSVLAIDEGESLPLRDLAERIEEGPQGFGPGSVS